MPCTCIPYSRVPHASALFVDYLYRFDRLAPFYSGSPFDSLSYRKLADHLAGFHTPRQQLAEILNRQNQAFGSAQPSFASISRLSQPGTFAVVTGQQVGLLSGPAFTLYKALTAVRLAQSLNEQGLPAVPVFWLATEDHDLEEVAEAATLNDDYELLALRDPGERPAPRSPVGQVRLSPGISAALDQLEQSLPAGEPREQLLQDLRACYRPGTTWGLAFGRFLARLFSRWGVVLLDPLDAQVHQLTAPVYQQALDQAAGLRERLQERSAAMMRAGYHAQAHVAEDSTLLFVEREGNRLALHQGAGEFLLDGTQRISLAELKAWAEKRPLDFSSNVLLRPVTQDMILPTVAYVAGPSELAYLGQVQSIYEGFGRPMPLIFPRVAFTLLDRRTQRLMEKYHLALEDVWQGEEHLSQKIAAAGFAQGWAERLEQSEQDLARLLARLRQDIEALDPTLSDSLKHTQEKMAFQMERLKGKITRAALQRSELLGRHEREITRFLAPHKDLQERRVSGIYFLGRAGYGLLEHLLSQVQTASSDHQQFVF